jgi:hypothetical protein
MAGIEELSEDTSTTITQMRKHLINSDILTDVTFLIGPNKIPIKAHKAFLASASQVFLRQFCGQFENDGVIDTPDIEEESFMLLLNHIYGQQIDLTIDNVFGVLYCAEKYMMGELKVLCQTYLMKNTVSSNLLEVFEQNQILNNPCVNSLCLNEITTNPYDYFAHPQFLRLSKITFAKIVQSRKINCTVKDLQEITLKWLNEACNQNYTDLNYKAYETLNGFGIEQSCLIEKLLTDNIKLFTMPGKVVFCCINSAMKTKIINLRHGMSLHGIGVMIGVINDGNSNDSEVMKITIQQDQRIHYDSQLLVRQTNTITIVPIMFSKITVEDPDAWSFKISFAEYRTRFSYDDSFLFYILMADHRPVYQKPI